jgi:Mg2+/citrate symporter
MGMEDETRMFLVKIANTIASILLWMMANVFFGIYKQFGFFDKQPTWINWLYYVLGIASFVTLLIYLRRKWKV